jgi:spermidine synthase
MIPWVQLGSASVPGGGGELRLMQRGAEFSIMAGSIELMSSRLSGSEEALAALTCEPLAKRSGATVLIGGLGMGFTLRKALAVLGPDAEVILAELVPEVVDWAKGPMAALHGESLSDRRVTLYQGDVGDLIGPAKSRFDAIVLDVDNGPEGLMRKANDELYDDYGLAEARDALKRGGVLAVWSSDPHPAFTKRLKAAGFGVEEVRAFANGRGKGARHMIWLATRR